MAGHIVVVHQGALGDFLLSLTVLQGFARAYPYLRFFFRTRSEHARLIASESYYAGSKSGDGADLAPFFLSSGWESAPLSDEFDGADAALIFGQASSIPLAENLSRRLSYGAHWVQSFPTEGAGEHVTRFIATQMRALGWTPEEGILHLEPSPSAGRVVELLLDEKGIRGGESVLVVHMGSGGRRKIWPIPAWRMLLEGLSRERRGRLVTVLGPADEPLRPIAHDMARDFGLIVMEGLSLPQLAALLARASGYVGNDSGVTHLAAAMGAPTVALFGPTRPEVWAPLGDHVHVIRSDWPTTDSLEAVRSERMVSDVERVRRHLHAVLDRARVGED